MANNKSSGSGFFWGLVFGLVTGAVLALLYAPQPGDQTREQLAEQSVVLRERGRMAAEQLSSQMRDRYGEAMAQSRETYARTREEVKARYERAKNAD